MCRNAIEEELEVLYDAYYEELEQYANHQQQYVVSGGKIAPPPGPGPFPGSVALDQHGAVIGGPPGAKGAAVANRKGAAPIPAVNGRGVAKRPAAAVADSEDYDEEDDEEEYEDDEDEYDDDEDDDEEEDLPPARNARRPVPKTAPQGRGPPSRTNGRSDYLNFGSLTAAGAFLRSCCHTPTRP